MKRNKQIVNSRPFNTKTAKIQTEMFTARRKEKKLPDYKTYKKYKAEKTDDKKSSGTDRKPKITKKHIPF